MDKIVYLIALPFGFLWRHKKLAIILIIAGFGFMIYQQQFKPEPAPEIPQYRADVPSKIQNLPVIQTTTRYYYVQHFTEDDSTIYLNDFYAYDTEWTRYNSIPLPLDKKQIIYRSW